MKKIDEYINSVYAFVSGKEANDMKEEMRTHLYESVEELKGEGKSEQEAIDIALKRFGEEKQITKGVFSFFKVQNKIVKKLNIISIICLIFGISYFLVGNIFFDSHEHANKMVHKINEIIENDVVSEKEIEKINAIIEKEELEYFALYIQPDPSFKLDLPEVYNEWTKVITYGDIQKGNDFSKIGMASVDEKWFYEIGFKEHPILTSYTIPLSFIILFLVISIVSILIRQSFRKKVINSLLLN